MTWLYALVQLIDIRFYRSAAARKRRVAMGIPESLIAWLFGQMIAWFGIIYYGFTEDARWYLAGLVVLLLTFAAFPVRRNDSGAQTTRHLPPAPPALRSSPPSVRSRASSR